MTKELIEGVEVTFGRKESFTFMYEGKEYGCRGIVGKIQLKEAAKTASREHAKGAILTLKNKKC